MAYLNNYSLLVCSFYLLENLRWQKKNGEKSQNLNLQKKRWEDDLIDWENYTKKQGKNSMKEKSKDEKWM